MVQTSSGRRILTSPGSTSAVLRRRCGGSTRRSPTSSAGSRRERSRLSPLQGPGSLRFDRVPCLRRRHPADRGSAPRPARRHDPGQDAPADRREDQDRHPQARSRQVVRRSSPAISGLSLIEPSTNPPVGIDVGLESFLTTSDGEHEPNPRYQKTALPELRRSPAVAGPEEEGRQEPPQGSKRKVAKVHARVATTPEGASPPDRLEVGPSLRVHRGRELEHHEHAQERSAGPTRSASAGWSGFLLTLRSKAESAGVVFVEVDARGTSQECSACGSEVRKDLLVRRHDCPHCGLSLHRDENAARNILARGLLARTGPVGDNVRVA